MKLDADQRSLLLKIARNSLESGLRHGHAGYPEPASMPENLRLPGACFVTLHKQGRLRGCIGSLEAREPMAQAVAGSAFAAGFQDPRFPPLCADELTQVDLEISILSPLQDLDVSSEQDLIGRLRPGIDGLLLDEGRHHAVYLPSVWAQIPDPGQFVGQLKLKGGWPADYWSESMRVRLFQTESIHEQAA
ncbi:MAG: AmmeMemoRadiSam system protein A [Gammaproteobacteria bacterium]|nr:AmmeMemoRadiSam system protein A [Gammaproteobacteria bacterium]